MPLVRPGTGPLEEPVDEAHGRARKIDPALSDGPLVRVGSGRNQSEAELIQGLLLENGVPSVVRRSAGFDVPDFLAAGPRDVLVPESGAEVARELLRAVEPHSEDAVEPQGRPRLALLVAAIAGGGAAAALIAWLLQ
jgi:Putative prokaryotic signal transducing protein